MPTPSCGACTVCSPSWQPTLRTPSTSTSTWPSARCSPGHAAAPDCFAGMEVSARGTKVAGAPIGDDDFCAEFVGQRVDTVLAKIRALRGMHPQVGMLLLRMCCLPQLNYLAQVVPPSITAQHFARFDAGVAAFVLELLTPRGRTRLACSDERMSVFRRRLRLPLRLNGAGLIGMDSIGAAQRLQHPGVPYPGKKTRSCKR